MRHHSCRVTADQKQAHNIAAFYYYTHININNIEHHGLTCFEHFCEHSQSHTCCVFIVWMYILSSLDVTLWLFETAYMTGQSTSSLILGQPVYVYANTSVFTLQCQQLSFVLPSHFAVLFVTLCCKHTMAPFV